VVSRIPPAKSDLAIVEGDQAMVGDAHTVSEAAQIVQHIFGATERDVSNRPPRAENQGRNRGRSQAILG
jgi:hypothetical protein